MIKVNPCVLKVNGADWLITWSWCVILLRLCRRRKLGSWEQCRSSCISKLLNSTLAIDSWSAAASLEMGDLGWKNSGFLLYELLEMMLPLTISKNIETEYFFALTQGHWSCARTPCYFRPAHLLMIQISLIYVFHNLLYTTTKIPPKSQCENRILLQ